MRSLTAALVLALVAAAVPAMAGEPITIGETLKLQSKVLGEERTILVSTPATYARSQERYPVLYMTDGNAHLAHTRGTVDFLARNGLMPDVIIVGINNTDRTRDLTPTPGFYTEQDGHRRDIPTAGGAPRFLDFLATELFPYIESTYRTAPYRIFAGHSLGGLLALHTLAARPELFNALIAASPSLQWDNDYPLRTVEAFLKDRKELQRTLFVTMANEEDGRPAPTRFERLRAILGASRSAGFVWDARHMPEETHGSVVLRSHYWGLRKIFEGWQLPVDPATRRFTGTLVDVTQHYARLGTRLGYVIQPPEQTVNQVGYVLLGQDRNEDAIAVFRFNTGQYPASANVHDSLGEALEKIGRLDEALICYTKAVENARKTSDPLLDTFVRNRDRAAGASRKPDKP